jgi:D-alanyl-D-alanine carboxypeptidase
MDNLVNSSNLSQGETLGAINPTPFQSESSPLDPSFKNTPSSLNSPLPTVYGLDSDDRMMGTVHVANVLFGKDGNDRIRGGDRGDTLHGGGGQDRLKGDRGRDLLIGGSEDDALLGGLGRDTLKGQSGNDRLLGYEGSDYLDGGVGKDQVFGENGNDRLMDYDGGDRLIGGQGDDIFGVGSPTAETQSLIQDFQVGMDSIQILRLGATFAGLSVTDSRNGVLIKDQGNAVALLKGIKAKQLGAKSFIFGNAQLADTFQGNLDGLLEANQTITGLTSAVYTPDGSLWQGFGGVTNRETQTPVDENARFGMGSITKPIVATTILQLQEENKLTLDDTVSQWLPDLADEVPNSDRITIRQLLGHTSGIRNYTDEPELSDIFSDNPQSSLLKEYSLADLLSFIKDKPAQAEPGKGFSYSNTNYLLLGAIVETATGTNLATQLRQRIFEPLGLSDTFYAAQEPVSGNLTKAYNDLDGDGQLDTLSEIDDKNRLGLSWAGAAGAVVSTATDIAKFTQALGQGELLAPETLRQMIRDNSDLLGPEVDLSEFGLQSYRYGLGLTSGKTTNGDRFIEHSGGTLTWNSDTFYFPERQITSTVVGTVPLILESDDPLISSLATANAFSTIESLEN